MVDADGMASYTGQWIVEEAKGRGSLRWGRGMQVWPDGSVYEGYWENDHTNGHGRKVYGDGSYYIGSWEDGFQSGSGKLALANGDLYEGEFKEGDYHGKGT